MKIRCFGRKRSRTSTACSCPSTIVLSIVIAASNNEVVHGSAHWRRRSSVLSSQKLLAENFPRKYDSSVSQRNDKTTSDKWDSFAIERLIQKHNDQRRTSKGGPGHQKNEDEDDSLQLSLPIRPFAFFRNIRRQWTNHRPTWFKLPTKGVMEVVGDWAIVINYILLGFLGFQICSMIVDIVREVINELDLDDDSSPIPMSRGTSMSAKSAKKVVAWLEEGRTNGDAPPTGVPPDIILIAQNLHLCQNLPSHELERILTQLNRAEISLLATCLLRPDSHSDTFESVGGLFAAKAVIFQWLSSFKLPPPMPSSARRSAPTSNQPTQTAVPHYTQPVSKELQSPYKRFLQRESPSGQNKLNGLVLWGPPGCGKSLLIRSISHQSGLPTILVTPSLLQRKWYGETTNRIRTLFTLIDKLGSVLVVLDEVDGILRARRDEDHEANREMKTEWLQWWDGVASSLLSSSSDPSLSSSPTNPSQNRKCLVVAATNHPWDVDIAAWRRFQHRVYVGLPNSQDRQDLLSKWTKNLPVISPAVINYVITSTEGYSPSDLFTVLQSAVRSGPVLRESHDDPLKMEDFETVLSNFKATQMPPQYEWRLRSFIGSQTSGMTAHAGQSSTSGMEIMSSSSPMSDRTTVWNTPWGNFWQISVPVDSDTMDAIHRIWTWNSWDEQTLFGDFDLEDSDDERFDDWWNGDSDLEDDDDTDDDDDL